MSHKTSLWILGAIGGMFVIAYWIIPAFTQETYELAGLDSTKKAGAQAVAAINPEKPIQSVVTHVPVPKQVKAIYMSSCVAGTPSFRDQLVKIADTTEVNSILIDIKDYAGMLSFKSTNPELADYLSDRCRAPDMKEFIDVLHKKGIYVIGRITAFQDPFYAKRRPELAVKRASDGGMWADRKGINYLDPGSKEVWDHLVLIGKESYNIGFDELNYDYIRFPSDGNMSDIAFPYSKSNSKQEVIEDFFAYLNKELKPTGAILSADLFGMTTSSTADLNIGQILERALPYFDYIAPMVYPSHYPTGFMGYKNPAEYPYEVLKRTMDEAVVRTLATSSIFKLKGSQAIASTSPQKYSKERYDKNKIRPWLQDFDLGADYDATKVRAQIQATYDAGLNSWMLWAPSNKYTIGALRSN